MGSLMEKLGEIEDPRRGNAQRHELLDILAIALVASVCGAESCVDFAEFAEDREVLLRDLLSLKKKKNQIQPRLPPARSGGLRRAPSRPFSTTSAPPATGCLPSTARRCAAPSTAPRAARLCTSSPPSAAARASPSPSGRWPRTGNEILAARALLETLALDGLLVTGDALHAQAATAEVILELRRRLSVRAQGQPSGHAARGRGLLRRSARIRSTPSRPTTPTTAASRPAGIG